ncbi:DHA2 family efflux MFS transporter permease subunit [Acinetobacter rathckeae]|uniref:DHA2 family efflux MFS transporter permease subunit n=1 Tax=Acinetobacter rathckeae TaxID=2605272 RepID=UPI0018A33440|nr:DHA2 family efflux MFS transporter permease subunit [Acinetobacter rathckeae]MBF7688608.1 DHA2 family efflux MFS transporter permease subunit [Acinetobacter rathckeae]MBF7695855.1 DHA2 family efflux MFS transporter permease subunit [Acinetobacter rathckeae]
MSKFVPFGDLTGQKLLLATFFLALANFMVVVDTTIANVAVAHITGSLAVSTTQGTWVITSYAVAEAICVPLTGWLAGRFGAVKVFASCLIGFTTFSLLCGLSNSLEMLVFCRIGQGLFGGPLMPLSQTLLMRIHPPEKHAQAMGLWAMTTVVGPIVGPIMGGWICDNLSWHWIFFINLPIGIICVLGVLRVLKPAETPTNYVRVDVMGLSLLVIAVGALQLMLDLGHDHDWFSSQLILSLAVISAFAFAIFIVWEATEKNPIVNITVFRHRGFSIAVLTMGFGFGAFFGSIVLIPQWLQTNMGYTATWAGYVTATMGIGSVTMSPVVAKLSSKIDQRALASFGLLMLGGVTLMRAFWSNEADFMALAWPQILQGFAVPFFFIPLTNIALGSVEPNEVAAAAGLMNFVRTMGGAIGASLSVTLWDDHASISRSEMVSKLNVEPTLGELTARGFSQETALATISNLVNKEALTLAADHVFLVFSMIFVAGAMIIWLCPKPRKVEGAAPH